MGIISALLHFAGIEPRMPSTAYNFWSGFGSDLAEFAILGVVYRKLNCHADGCKRLGLHHVKGTPFITCRKHHPHSGNSAEQIAQAHQDAEHIAQATLTPKA